MFVFQLIWPATGLAFVLIVGLIVLLLMIERERRLGQTIGGTPRTIFWIYSGLNAIAAFTWIATLVELMPLRTRIPLTDYGAPLGGVILLLAVPVGLGLCYFLRIRSPAMKLPVGMRCYARLSTVYLLLSLFPGLTFALFYGLLIASDR